MKLRGRTVVATVSFALVTAGCTATEATTDPPSTAPGVLPSSASLTVEGMDLEPQLDEATGAVILPIDQFLPTWAEDNLLTVASAIELALCVRERGVTFLAPEPLDNPVYLSESYFGPWTTAQAERFGFVMPMSDADLVANGIVGAESNSGDDADWESHPNFALTDEDWVVIDECGASDAVQRYHDAKQLNGPWTERLDAAEDAILDSDEAVALLDELGACYTARGLTPDSELRWAVLGSEWQVITEQQVQLALTVVECKNETGFTEKMARLEARATVPVIAAFADELIEQRRSIDTALEQARALISANDDLIYHAS